VFCREHAVQLNRDREKFEDAGVRLVLIGQGTPRLAADFRRRFKIALPVITDDSRVSYKNAGMKKATAGELIGPSVVAKGIVRAARSGLVQGKTQGHPAQLGGVLVVKPDGSIPYQHLAKDASDTPPNKEVLAAAREAASG
jgi:peroxiredoxin